MSEGSRLKLAPAEWPEILQELRVELAHTKGLLESERAINAQLEQTARLDHIVIAHYRTALEYLRRRASKAPIAREDQLELAREVTRARVVAGPSSVASADWQDHAGWRRKPPEELRDEPVAYRVREPRKPV